jgi:hypothetical protein
VPGESRSFFCFEKVVQRAYNVIKYTNKCQIKATTIAGDEIRRLEIA